MMQYILLQSGAPANNTQQSATEAMLAARAIKHDNFGKHDPQGFGMTLIAMGVVLGALAVLSLIFKLIGKIATRKGNAKTTQATAATTTKTTDTRANKQNDALVAAMMALHALAQEARDEESGVVTIIDRAELSPWAIKRYEVVNGGARW